MNFKLRHCEAAKQFVAVSSKRQAGDFAKNLVEIQIMEISMSKPRCTFYERLGREKASEHIEYNIYWLESKVSSAEERSFLPLC